MAKEDIRQYEFTSEQSRIEAAENGRRGGIASGIAKRERKALADTLRAELAKMASKEGSLTKQEFIVAKCLEGLSKKTTTKDLRTIAEILGELKQSVEVSGNGVTVIVETKEQAEKLANIGNIGA